MRTNAHEETLAMLISAECMQLLANAEALLYDTECTNHCVHHRGEGYYCNECPNFKASSTGYITCDGFEQEEVEAA